MKEVIRRLLSRVVVCSGVAALGRKVFPKRGTLILFGHRVQADDEGFLQGLRPEWFREQVAYLVRNYEVIPLSLLLECFEKNRMPPANSAVLTFDDGFRDNFENVFPILQEIGVPATIFLVTGSIETGELPWPQRLGYMLQWTRQPVIFGWFTGGRELPLESAWERRRCSAIIKKQLGRLARTDREKVLGELARILDVKPPLDRMLNWEEAREMQASGLVEFGAHTVSHPWLEYLPLDEARWEMERSREDLREHLGLRNPPFAFPGGSFTPGLLELVKQLGFRAVFQSRPELRINSPATTNQYALSRVGLPNAPAYVLEAELDGPLHAIRGLYRRHG